MKDERPVTDEEAGLEPPYYRRPQQDRDSEYNHHIPWHVRLLLVALGACLGLLSFLVFVLVLLTD